MGHKAGFVSIVGKPNAGKSTLMNQLVGERLSIITSKAQTTRHRIMGIINEEDYQIVYSDTPGVIKPKYELHSSMMQFVKSSLEDADVLLVVTDIEEKFDEEDVLKMIRHLEIPVIWLINKVDLKAQEEIQEKIEFWKEKLEGMKVKGIVPVSALHNFNLQAVLESLKEELPEHPPFFSKDEITDKSSRFFASEIIREKIFLNYEQEVPYATEVVIQEFKDEKDIIRVYADILVERQSQKGIIIGKQGQMLKKVGTEARKDMEAFFGKKIFLQQFVKVEPDWRRKKTKLSRLGYTQ
ncbi:GTPase Era [Flammeovirgaceae bacterium SG7u.111]|nr:GTPase Era [Flammeovirgaceae bacterium SG7u.132]WPO33729.1 GTPase Era [Flammeovirgaceae bacterium SG7u.111]